MVADRAHTNALTIGCPRAGCRCKIVRPGAATLVRRQPPTQLPAFGADIAAVDVPDEVAQLLVEERPALDGAAWFWRLKDMMDFENVGFSKPVDGLKYLSCADCDLAPLGYHDTTGAANEFLVAVDRVVYRQ